LANHTFVQFGLSDRDYGLFVLEEFDIEAQLIAIRDFLRRNSKADKRVSERIAAYAEQMKSATGDEEYFLDSLFVDECHGSVFQDAAHSLAAAGMLSPLIEGYFTVAFPNIAKQLDLFPRAIDGNIRSANSVVQYWDPHFVFGKKGTRKDIVGGIVQIAQSMGLSNALPNDYQDVFNALFRYRNKVFHHGFEWPMDERKRFKKAVSDENWPETWFTESLSGGEPWIIYMSQEFIEKCLSTFESCLEGVGSFLRLNSS